MKNRGRRLLAVAVIGPALAICAAGPGLATRAGATFTTAARSPGSYVYSLITVGMPDRSVPGAIQAGVVDVYFHDGRKQTLTEKKLGLGATAYSRFGTSIAVSDLNNDGLADLIVGAPGVPGKGLTGHIDVLIQSAAGFVSGNASPIDGETTDDQFGTAVAVSSRLSSPVARDLWVGAPGNDVQKTSTAGVETVSNAGDVSRYDVTQNGQIVFSQNISQATPNIPDTPEKNDRFGEVLAPANNGVVVGIPHEDVGAAVDAGEVIRIRTNTQNDAVTSSLVFTQNSAGVGGSAQSGDRFGAALSPYGAAIGVPGDDVGKLKDAGTVQVFDPDVVTGALTPLRSLSQNSAGVPGTAEAGDQFGAALSTGYYRCKDAYQLAVGSPGEDIGKAKNAGTVTVLTIKGWSNSACVSKLLSQGGGKGLLGGAVETGDGVGSSLGSVNGEPIPTNRLDTLVVGAPGEDIGKTKNTGRTTIWSGYSKGFAVSFGYQGGDFSNLGYGKVFGTESINSAVA